MRKELENRLIKLSVQVTHITSRLTPTRIARNLHDQVVRSSTSAALNYGEAQSAESRKDFIHKNSLVLKELRETGISLKILKETVPSQHTETLSGLVNECNELTAIFQQTVNTLKLKSK